MAGTGRVVAFTPDGDDSRSVDESATDELALADGVDDDPIALPDPSVESGDDPFDATALLTGVGALVVLIGIGGFILTRRRSSAAR